MEPGTNRSPAEAPRDGPLEGVRARSGEGVAELFNSFPDTISTEHVAQAMLKGDDKPVRESSQTFKYLLLAKPEGQGLGLEEYRTDLNGSRADVSGTEKGFMLTAGFASISLYLHPAYQSGSDFRLLGTQGLVGAAHQVGMDGRHTREGRAAAGGDGEPPPVHG